MSKYFAYGSMSGLELFDTAEEAKDCAQSQIDWLRDDAVEGWSEEVESICWGIVKQQAEESTFNAGDEDDPDKEYSDYYLDDTD